MAYNYEYEDYLERKHNNRVDVLMAISRSERIKRILEEKQSIN